MFRTLLLTLTVFMVMSLQSVALADYATTPQPYPTHPQPYYPAQPYPYYGAYPYPVMAPAPGYAYPQFVTCFARGMANGALFYGVGNNVYVANQWAMYACNSSGQYCQLTGCRY